MQKIQKKFQFFQLINKLRQQPHTQIQEITKILATFNNQNQYTYQNILYHTKQGQKPWLQSIQFLKRQIPIKQLSWSQGLYLAAKEYSRNLNYSKKCDPFEFIQQQVTYSGQIRIWMNCGCTSVNHFLNYAIISDGDLKRDQRKSLFNPKYKFFGSYLSKNQKYGNMLVYFLAQSAQSKRNEKITANKLIKQINKLRSNPKCYINQLKNQIGLFKDKKLIFNKNEILQTYQGKSAWLQCIQFLNNQQPVPQLNYLKQLNKIALKKSKYPKIPFSKFIKKFDIDGKARYIQNFGTADCKQILTNLIVSDGDSSRITRNTIFSEQFNCIGGYIDISPNNQNSGLLLIQLKVQGVNINNNNNNNNNSIQQANNSSNSKQYLNLITHDFLNNKILENRVKSSLQNYNKLRINTDTSKSISRNNYFNQKILNELSRSTSSKRIKQKKQIKNEKRYNSIRQDNLITLQRRSTNA